MPLQAEIEHRAPGAELRDGGTPSMHACEGLRLAMHACEGSRLAISRS